MPLFFLVSLAVTLAGLTAVWLLKPRFLQSRRHAIFFAGSIVVLVITGLAYQSLVAPQLARGLVLAAGLIVLIGWYDERWQLSPLLQFLGQVVIVAVVVASGWTISYVTSPLGHGLLYLMPAVGSMLAGVWLLSLMNAVNWFDGMDGLAGSISVVAFTGLAIISVLPTTADPQALQLALIGLGATLAFLVWNWSPARVYLGTTGSWFLGLFIGLVALYGQGKIAITILILAIPLVDAVFVIIRRIRIGQRPWQGDEQHLHHRLKRYGLPDWSIAVLCVVASALLMAGGVAVLLRYQHACPDFSQHELVLNGVHFQVAVATTEAEKARGLSGCPALPDKAGELFVFQLPSRPTFWMKDMLLPLDLVWLKDGKVIGVTESIPAPARNTPDSGLRLYRPPADVDAVLEIGAGKAAEYGLSTSF
jgi:UDP-GlcNAc:undecaprenyl-phosphate GlcNAc-1-phosphate transferase